MLYTLYVLNIFKRVCIFPNVFLFGNKRFSSFPSHVYSRSALTRIGTCTQNRLQRYKKKLNYANILAKKCQKKCSIDQSWAIPHPCIDQSWAIFTPCIDHIWAIYHNKKDPPMRVFSLVPRAGVEPARIAPLVFETSASTDSAIWANFCVLRANFCVLRANFCVLRANFCALMFLRNPKK